MARLFVAAVTPQPLLMAVPLIRTPPPPAASPADTGQPPKMKRAKVRQVDEALEVQDAQPLVRRSTRARKRPAAFDQEAEYKPAPSASRGEPNKRIKIVQRRNPPRKATASPLPEVPLPDDVLLEAFAPMRPEELQQWRGWTEVESEPVSSPHASTLRYPHHELTTPPRPFSIIF